MGNANKPLRDLLDALDEGNLVLPEIQRDFVWKKKNVLLLFDSLYRGLPIGFMLVWKAKTAVPTKNIKHSHTLSRFYGYLLDGQQRLTAIQRVRDHSDSYPLLFSLRQVNSQDPGKDRFLYATRKTRNDPWYLPVAEVLSRNFSPTAVVDKLKALDQIEKAEEADAVIASLSRLGDILKYPVGVIEFEEDDYQKATELFIRFNSTGKKLNRTDLASAELALQAKNLVTKHIRPCTTKFDNYRFTMPFLIQCFAAVHTSKIKFKDPQEIWDGKNERAVTKSWKATEKGISRTINFLSGTVKWNCDRWLPSANALIPIVYILSQRRFSAEERKLARKWLLRATMHAYFSGSVHTTLDHLIKKLHKNPEGPTIQKLWKLTARKLPKLSPEDFDTRRRSGAVMSLYISMLRNQHAKDWITDTPLDGNVVGHNAELQVHHFFPQALLRRHGVASELINSFGNYTIINKETNIEIGDKEPFAYIKEYHIGKRLLQAQCIPANRDLWRVEQFEDFVEERRNLLAKKANEFI